MGPGYSGNADGYATYTAYLPLDSSVPRKRNCSVSANQLVQHAQPRACFKPDFVRPSTDDERRAWFFWQAGHLHLFAYWIMETDACRRASRAIRNDDPEGATRWMERATTLRWGEIAATYNSGDITQKMYKDFIRPSMETVRPDFSGRSARDYLALLLAMEEMKRDCQDVANPSKEFLKARENFASSCKGWWTHHNVIVEKLAPEKSLALREHQRMVHEEGLAMTYNEYRVKIIQSNAAQDDYDRYFGVIRKELTLAEFAMMVLDIVRHIHTRLDLPSDQFRWLIEGDRMMLAILKKLQSRQINKMVA